MQRVLVSACLLGRPVRYNGTEKLSGHAVLERWQREGRVVSVCPEVAVGFPTPRPPAEIQLASGRGDDAVDGGDVLAGRARVMEDTGGDVTDRYLLAAHQTVELAKRHGCAHAVLTDGSPSCGSTFVYDGTFAGRIHPGAGSTTAALEAAGVRIWAESAIDELDQLLRTSSG